MNYEQEINALKRQVKSLRRQQQMQGEWLDTVNSPLPKRIFWFLCGWNFYTLGRWYGKEKYQPKHDIDD